MTVSVRIHLKYGGQKSPVEEQTIEFANKTAELQ
jgi:hypothetical protein